VIRESFAHRRAGFDPGIACYPPRRGTRVGLLLPQIWRGITFDHCMNLPELGGGRTWRRSASASTSWRDSSMRQMPQRRKSSKSGRTNYGSDRPLSSTSARNVNRCRRTGGTAG